jgi:hypothetical protein
VDVVFHLLWEVKEPRLDEFGLVLLDAVVTRSCHPAASDSLVFHEALVEVCEVLLGLLEPNLHLSPAIIDLMEEMLARCQRWRRILCRRLLFPELLGSQCISKRIVAPLLHLRNLDHAFAS